MQNSWFYCRLLNLMFTKFDVLCHFFINTAVDAIKVNKSQSSVTRKVLQHETLSPEPIKTHSCQAGFFQDFADYFRCFSRIDLTQTDKIKWSDSKQFPEKICWQLKVNQHYSEKRFIIIHLMIHLHPKKTFFPPISSDCVHVRG